MSERESYSRKFGPCYMLNSVIVSMVVISCSDVGVRLGLPGPSIPRSAIGEAGPIVGALKWRTVEVGWKGDRQSSKKVLSLCQVV